MKAIEKIRTKGTIVAKAEGKDGVKAEIKAKLQKRNSKIAIELTKGVSLLTTLQTPLE